jgi:hypothetical protein
MHLTAQTVNSGTAECFLKNLSNYIINTVLSFIFVAAIIYILHSLCKPKKKILKFAITSLEGPLGLQAVKTTRFSRPLAHEIVNTHIT